MELHGGERDGEGGIRREEEQLGKLVGVGQEDRVDVALEASKDVGAKVLLFKVSDGAMLSGCACPAVRRS